MRDGNYSGLRIAFFPDAYHEVDGVANTSRHFEAFAQKHALDFLLIHAGPGKFKEISGSVTRVQFPRGPLTLHLDRAHRHDLAFWRHYREIFQLVQDFAPDVLLVTGPSDVGMLGALVAHNQHVPLAATWQTNIHQFARSRLRQALAFLPRSALTPLLNSAQSWVLGRATRFYKIPQLLFAPNQEMIDRLEATTGKPCFLMAHSVDANVFSPAFRDPGHRPFTIGYVGRLTPEKNVRLLASLEQALHQRGGRDFRFIVVGEGSEGPWLREQMPHAHFTGILTGQELSRAFANMDLFVFPSETDTFGLVVLEALASGVPAIVTAAGGPKETVIPGKTGYIANNLGEFIAHADRLRSHPELLPSMRLAARNYALSTSWDQTFRSMCEALARCTAGDQLAAAALA